MKTLFLMIILITAGIVELVSPDSGNTPPAVTENPGRIEETIDELTDEIEAIIRPAATEIPAEPTAAPTAAPIVSGEDMKTIFGDPVVTDNFERGSSGFGINAGLNDDDAIRIIALNNTLSLEPKKNNGWITWRLRPPVQTDGAAEMEFSITTCARGDRTGIIMHSPDYSTGHGYYFTLACEGTVSILMDTTILASAEVPELFRNTSGDTNVMTAVSVQDSTYPSGYAGFFTAPQGDRTLTMEITSFTEYSRN